VMVVARALIVWAEKVYSAKTAVRVLIVRNISVHAAKDAQIVQLYVGHAKSSVKTVMTNSALIAESAEIVLKASAGAKAVIHAEIVLMFVRLAQ